MEFNSRDFRNAMGQFPTGVVVVSCLLGDEAHAMTANAFMSGSLEPPLIVVSIDKTSAAHGKIKECKSFAVSILKESQTHTSDHFAGRKLENFEPCFEHLNGYPVIKDAAVQAVSELIHTYECGDHTLCVGKVHSLHNAQCDENPLMFHRGQYSKLEK